VIPWATVQALLQSIDRKQSAGWRDYTILYLMARYGLRPCEVASLRLDAIDWQAKTLRVDQRKTRSVLILPVADRTLRVIKRCLNAGRTGSTRPELFLRFKGSEGSVHAMDVSVAVCIASSIAANLRLGFARCASTPPHQPAAGCGQHQQHTGKRQELI
jgi:integrase